MVIVFTSGISSNACGKVGGGAWLGGGSTFVATNGLDLRSKESNAVGLVDVFCDVNIAAHEFGHLLGGGHYNPPGPSLWLNDDSKGFAQAVNILVFGAPIIFNVRSSVTNPGDCDSGNPAACILTEQYSSASPYNNMKAFNQTAQSVANYRSVVPIPLVLIPPKNVTGHLVSHCSPPPWSFHGMFWQEGGSTAAVTYFLVESALYSSSPVFSWWTTTAESTPVYVTGTSFFMSARACNSEACSGRSSEYFANWSACGFDN